MKHLIFAPAVLLKARERLDRANPLRPLDRFGRMYGAKEMPKLRTGGGDRTYSIDANMILSDGAVAITSTGFSQYAGADGIVDLGGNQNVTITLPSIADVTSIIPQQPRIDACLVIDLTAITTTGTASAKLILVGCNNPAFGSSVQQLAMMEFGAAASLSQSNGVLTPAPAAVGGSRYELPFTNEQNNTKFQYAKLQVIIANSGSITFKAFVAVLQEP